MGSSVSRGANRMTAGPLPTNIQRSAKRERPAVLRNAASRTVNLGLTTTAVGGYVIGKGGMKVVKGVARAARPLTDLPGLYKGIKPIEEQYRQDLRAEQAALVTKLETLQANLQHKVENNRVVLKDEIDELKELHRDLSVINRELRGKGVILEHWFQPGGIRGGIARRVAISSLRKKERIWKTGTMLYADPEDTDGESH